MTNGRYEPRVIDAWLITKGSHRRNLVDGVRIIGRPLTTPKLKFKEAVSKTDRN
jgi:hypothetical protein